MNLRPYQSDAVAAVHAAFDAGGGPTLGVLATGGGKTVIAAHAIANRPGRAMFVAHRKELIWQAAKTIERVTGERPAVEMADYRADAQPMYKARVVVSTVQTQYAGRGGEGRMKGFDPMEFGTFIFDEAHHAVSPANRKMLDHYRQNPALCVLGLTATPDRTDGKAMGQIFTSTAFDCGIRELIEGGWLCPVDQQMIPAPQLDLSDVGTNGGDLAPTELAQRMEEEGPLHAIAYPTLDIVGDRKTLVFAAGVKHAELLSEIFNRHRPGSSRWISDAMPDDPRRELFADYAAGRFQFLVNVGIATEGFDDPGVEVVVMGRPTKSRALYTQMIGRGTRPSPGLVDLYEHAEDRRIAIATSWKPCVLVLDFASNSGRHKLVTAADVLGGDYDPVVVAKAKERVAEDGTPADMLEALKDAAAELHAAKEREKAIEHARRERLRVRAEYTTEAVDPFDVFNVRPSVERAWDRSKPLTPKMRATLEKHGPKGLDVDNVPYAQAGRMIGEIQRRWSEGLCTVKQAAQLQKRGLPTDVSKDVASDWMNKIVAAGWKVPADLQRYVRPPGAAPRDLSGVEF